MFTKDTVDKEIRHFMRGPVTDRSTGLLACLLYIRDCLPPCGEEPAMTEAELCNWVDRMENADGTVGARWAVRETEKVQRAIAPELPEDRFWCAMNMMYSDYGPALEESGVSNLPETCARLAAAFLKDRDAKPNKLYRYWNYVSGAGPDD